MLSSSTTNITVRSLPNISFPVTTNPPQMEPSLVVDCHCHTGESPTWHEEQECVLWVDIPKGELLEYDPASGIHRTCYTGNALRSLTPAKDGTMLAFEADGTILACWNGSVRTLITDLIPENSGKINDTGADPAGRVFVGVLPTGDEHGRLLRIEENGDVTPMLDDLEFPNGLGFSPNHEFFYLTDSYANRIYRFDFDVRTGSISNRDVYVDTSEDPGVPDGLAVDKDGYVWSGRWNGGRLVRYNPDGGEEQSVSFPACKVTSLGFGGAAWNRAFVTTALASSTDPIGNRDVEGEGAGGLFEFEPPTPGLPEYRAYPLK